jgi:ABC-type phosphate transport system substrate-binding protein
LLSAFSERTRYAAGVALLAIVALVTSPASAQSSGGYVVIVNPANSVTQVDEAYLARVFLKKLTHWSDGELMRPVDQSVDSGVRRRFDEEVLGRSVAGVRNQWQQAIFAGRDVPPPELDSDTAVVEFVLKYPGAIGYVSTHADVRGARVLVIK